MCIKGFTHCYRYTYSMITYSSILLFSTDSGFDVFLITGIVSPWMWVAPSMGMPIIHNLQCIPYRTSTPVLMAINSAPKVHLSIVDCPLEHQLTKAVFRHIRNLFCNLCVRWSPAWSLSKTCLDPLLLLLPQVH